MYGVHFALDRIGDGLPDGTGCRSRPINEAEVDRLLGCVLTYSD